MTISRVLIATWLLLAVFLVLGGPVLSTHEVIVAQIARQSLLTGDWIVLHFLDAPFLVKPPLPPWLVGAFGWLLPNDSATGLPVTQVAARLPSVLATVLTAWIVFLLARSMYSAAVGRSTVFIYATCLGTLQFAFNATAEALLTLFCTWCFAEFWWSRQTMGRQRRVHQLRFYVAFGMAMLAKGPMPLAVVCVPIAAWWWLEGPVRLIATGGGRGVAHSLRRIVPHFFRRLRTALTGLGVWWGLVIVALIFMPWMLAVGARVPFFWKLWRFEYLDRFENEHLWTRESNPAYYLVPMLAMAIPWTLSLPEALASPFLRAYQKNRRALTYAWFWVVGTVIVLTLQTFKQDYYLLPLLPGCAFLLGPVVHRLFFPAEVRQAGRGARAVIGLAVGGVVIGSIAAWIYAKHEFRDMWSGSIAACGMALAVLLLVGVAYAGLAYLRGRPHRSFVTIGLLCLTVFSVAWLYLGPRFGNVDAQLALVRRLDEAGVGRGVDLYWTNKLPEGRITFYGNRLIRQVVDPFELRAENRTSERDELQFRIGDRICRMLADDEKPVFFVFKRDRYQLFMKLLRPRAYPWFEIDRAPKGPDDDDWVVVSNRAPPARRASSSAAAAHSGV